MKFKLIDCIRESRFESSMAALRNLAVRLGLRL